MSGSGPKDDPLDISGHARRQRHADFPEPLSSTATTRAATTATTTTATTTTAPGPLVTPNVACAVVKSCQTPAAIISP